MYATHDPQPPLPRCHMLVPLWMFAGPIFSVLHTVSCQPRRHRGSDTPLWIHWSAIYLALSNQILLFLDLLSLCPRLEGTITTRPRRLY